jgi:choline dehydrogenase-like flavoprotein
LILNEKNRAIDEFEGIGIAFRLASSILQQNQLNVQFEIRKFMPKPYLLVKILDKHNLKSVDSTKLFSFLLFLEKGFRFIFRKIRVRCEFLIGKDLFSIYVKAEELAYGNSRAFLEDVSKNILTYDHKVSEKTFDLLLLHLQKFEEIFNKNFKVKFKYFKEIKKLDGVQTFFGPNWHPMGTVRMGTDPNLSICNPNLEIHSIKNLFVLSAAVFPSGSNSNPTFTTLALADRLAKSCYF